jgi:DNA-binding SARP family transcriptional activator
MPPTQIRLLGEFQLVWEGTPVADLSGRQQTLIAYILLQPNQSASRQQAAFTLWPDSTDGQARTNLRRLLLLLHRTLPQIDDLLDITRTTLAWRPQTPIDIDFLIFQEALAPAKGPDRRSLLAKAVEAYAGELMPDCYDEWIHPERERLRNAYAQALADLTLLAEQERDYAVAIDYARRLLRHDPLHEVAYRRLMRLLALTGDRAGALQSYHTCATLLRREIGVDPGPETQQIYTQLLAQDVATQAGADSPDPAEIRQMVGRADEWRTLQEIWRRCQPTPHWALITGEAGMGKSRLAEEMLTWGERQGIPTAHARAYASSGGVSYGPVVDLLRSRAIRKSWEKLADPWLLELSRLLPEISTAHPHLPPPPPLAEEWQKRRIFEALALALTGDGRPHLLVLDDLQWADHESLEFVAFLLRRRPPAQLLLVGTARSEEMLDNPILQTVVREMESQGQLTHLPLASLTLEETGQLAAQTGGAVMQPAAVHALYADSGGNPLFVVEMVRAKEGYWGLDNVSPGPILNTQYIPSLLPKLQTVIEARLARLSSQAREIAAQAAVLGRSFTYPMLAAACALDEAALVDGLDELWRRSIIREVGDNGYDFSHDRIRDVAYGVISQARRRLFHRRAGEALLRVYVEELEPMHGQLGYHFASAGENPAAIDHYCQAAAVALKRYAHAEAADYLTAALTLAESAGDAAVYPLLAERERINRLARRPVEWRADLTRLTQLVERLEDGSRDAVLRRAGLALSRHYYEAWTNDSQLALDAAQEALALARASADQVLEVEAITNISQQLWRQGRLDAAQAMQFDGYTKARSLGLVKLTAESLERQVQILMFGGGSAVQMREIIAECLSLYTELADESGKGEVYVKMGHLELAQGEGDYRYAQASCMQGLESGRRSGNWLVEMKNLRTLAVLHICQGDYPQAIERLDEALAIMLRLSAEPNRAVLDNYRGFWLMQQGRLDEARVAQEQSLAQFQMQRLPLWMVKAITALGWIAFYEGMWQEAEEWATQGIAESEAFNEERQVAHSCTCRGWARLRQGRVHGAIADFQRSAQILLQMEMVNRAQEPLAGLAQAAWQMGDLQSAHTQTVPIAGRLLTHPLDRTEDTFLAIHTCHAILAAAGDPLAADVHALAQEHLHYRAANIEPAYRVRFWAMPGHLP